MGSFPNFVISTGLNSALERVEEITSLINKFSPRQTKYAFSSVLREKFSGLIFQVAKENNVDPKLVEAVIDQESKFNPNAISSSGALGLMQLAPGTAHAMGVKDPLNPQENIRGGTKYLSSLLNRYQGNVILALSAYNAGPSNVDKFKGVPPFKETRNYVEAIISKLT